MPRGLTARSASLASRLQFSQPEPRILMVSILEPPYRLLVLREPFLESFTRGHRSRAGQYAIDQQAGDFIQWHVFSNGALVTIADHFHISPAAIADNFVG